MIKYNRKIVNQDKKTVLALLAHPDDAEFLCGGTLALLALRNWEIHIATSTAGDLGSRTLPPNEIAEIRRGEGVAAARIIGAHYHCLELKDLQVFYGEKGLSRVIALLRRIQPDLVITHSPSCYMIDHEETSRLVRAGCFAAPVPHIAFPKQYLESPLGQIPFLYYADSWEGFDLFGKSSPATLAIHITSVFGTKLEMLRCHASQQEWLHQHHKMDDYLEIARNWSQKRGIDSGFKHAEVFRQHLGHAYPRNNLLGQTLKDVSKNIVVTSSFE